MALDNMAPEVWAARILMTLEAESVYEGLLNRNYEADASGANKVRINTITSDIVVSDYTKNTDLTAAQLPDDSQQEMNLDQQKYFHLFLDDIDRVQSNSNLMGEYARKAGIAIAQTKDTFASTTLSAGVKAANQVTAAVPSAGATQTAAEITTTGTNLFHALIDVLEKVETANISAEAMKWMVLTPFWQKIARRWFLDNPTELFVPATAEEMLRSGTMGTFYGFSMRVSNRAPQVKSTDAILIGTSDAATYADQIQQIEGMRSTTRFGDVMRGLYVYGAKVTDDDQLFRIEKA